MISGTLLKPPDQRMSKTNKPYVMAQVSVADGTTSDFCTVFAYREEARAELTQLDVGDRLSAQGRLQVELYTGKDGKQRINRSIADAHVLALRRSRATR